MSTLYECFEYIAREALIATHPRETARDARGQACSDLRLMPTYITFEAVRMSEI
jgi:hypothetical protein